MDWHPLILWKTIKTWIERVEFVDQDQKLTAFFLQVISLVTISVGLIIGAVYLIALRFDYLPLVFLSIAISAFVLFLTRRKKLKQSINLLIFSCLGLLVMGVLVAGGIHAIASVLFPVLVLFSSVLMERKIFIQFTALAILSVGMIVFAEAQHLIPPYLPDPAEPPLFIVYTLIIVGTAIFGRFITESLQNNLRQAHQREQELAAQTQNLKKAQQEILDLNNTLERRVTERTMELENAVRELESFSYTVGHDLRAPLRHIHGYCNFVREDCAEILPQKSLDDLLRIENAAKNMGDLVDTLLAFSRLARTPVHYSLVDLSTMVEEISTALLSRGQDPAIEFQITPGLLAQADSELMHVLLVCLLDNACKFTSREHKARVEFGAQDQDGSMIYYIRDNGVGFDMAYSHKLFQPFQRLHHAHEFPGNGAGLVAAQRIIHRHGGKIWAEGRVNQGATVYFTLS